MRTRKFSGMLLLAGAAAMGVSLACSQAIAQDYGSPEYYGPPGPSEYYTGAPPEEVYVYGPHRRPERDPATGAPIENVALQRPVPFDDLDLRTPWGAWELRDRISYTARTLCDRLDAEYPVAAPDNPPCYQTAMDDAMEQADAAIAQARGGY